MSWRLRISAFATHLNPSQRAVPAAGQGLSPGAARAFDRCAAMNGEAGTQTPALPAPLPERGRHPKLAQIFLKVLGDFLVNLRDVLRDVGQSSSSHKRKKSDQKCILHQVLGAGVNDQPAQPGENGSQTFSHLLRLRTNRLSVNRKLVPLSFGVNYLVLNSASIHDESDVSGD